MNAEMAFFKKLFKKSLGRKWVHAFTVVHFKLVIAIIIRVWYTTIYTKEVILWLVYKGEK
jgi:hypothetical protein